MRRERVPAPVPAPLQPHLAGPRRSRTGSDGTERLDLPADAHPVRRQRSQRPRPPQLRPHHERHLTPAMARPPPPTRAGTAGKLRGQGMPGTGHGRPATQDLTRLRRPREQGAARCPAAALRPRPWPSRRVTYHNAESPAAAPIAASIRLKVGSLAGTSAQMSQFCALARHRADHPSAA
jgi:hypothetical protein